MSNSVWQNQCGVCKALSNLLRCAEYLFCQHGLLLKKKTKGKKESEKGNKGGKLGQASMRLGSPSSSPFMEMELFIVYYWFPVCARLWARNQRPSWPSRAQSLREADVWINYKKLRQTGNTYMNYIHCGNLLTSTDF